MVYNTYESSGSLRGIVRCYWTLKSTPDETLEPQRIVPDGCCEMLFHLGDLYEQILPSGERIVQPRCFVFGQITEPLTVKPTGETDIFSVRFTPEGFSAIAPVPLKTLANCATSLSTLFGQEAENLSSDIIKAKATESRIRLIESFIVNQLSQEGACRKAVAECIAVIMRLKGQLSVDELSQHAAISEREMERKFTRMVGLSPKKLTRIVRIHQAAKSLIHGENESLTAVALENQFYDQAHFNREFKAFTGVSPSRFFKENNQLSSHLTNNP